VGDAGAAAPSPRTNTTTILIALGKSCSAWRRETRGRALESGAGALARRPV
jgi:hypothetical protein